MKIRREESVIATLDLARKENESLVGDDVLSRRDEALIEGLVVRGVMTSDDAARILATFPSADQPLPLYLARQNISDVVVAEILSAIDGVTCIDLTHVEPDPAAIALINEEIARRRLIVPMRIDNGYLNVACAVEASEELRDELEGLTSNKVRLFGAPLSEVRRTIDRSYRAMSDIDVLVQAFNSTEKSRKRTSTSEEITSDGAPVAQLVTRILTQAIRDRASDVHIEPKEHAVQVRYRVDGAMTNVAELPSDIGPGLVSRIKIMAGMNIVERRRPQDGQLRMDLADTSVDVRVATMATIFGEMCVMRILDKSRSVYELSELGMPLDTHETFAQLARSPFGMILCVGPTGSGKTTTLYATLSEIDDSTRNVMTIEDPVEYVFPAINQIQTNEAADLTFASSLRSILRSDPDVILVGEIRDVETARIAVQSALTGHLVLSSLHATDSVSALLRFVDMGIEPFLVSSSILAVVAQRLVRRTCTSCKVTYAPSDEELAFFRDAGGDTTRTFYRGEGCNVCAGTGFHDRVGVYELLRVSPEIKRLVASSASQDQLASVARGEGMRTLRDEVVSLVEQGVTTINEIVRTVYVA